jgi:hypothetical protein
MSILTAEQTIRLEVLRTLPPGLSATQKVADIRAISEAIIGEVAKPDGPRVVNYEGKQLVAPAWAHYVAADYDGEIYFYELDPGQNQRIYAANGAKSECVEGQYLEPLCASTYRAVKL